jgi:tetratricopeptide (TPR) repeat protein
MSDRQESQQKAENQQVILAESEKRHMVDDLSPQIWLLALLTLLAAVILMAILAFAPIGTSLAWLAPTPIPTPIPTATLTPAQIAVGFEPQLRAALYGQHWDRALELVVIMESVDPASDRVPEWYVLAYLQYGQALLEDDSPYEAQTQFDHAVSHIPDHPKALLWQATNALYIQGQEAVQVNEWDEAISAFTQAQDLMPDYPDISDLLVDSHRSKGQEALDKGDWVVGIKALTYVHNRVEDPEVVGMLADAFREKGTALYKEGDYQQARADLEAALSYRPDDGEAKATLDKVMYILFPPKRIEINISTQRFLAYEGDRLVYQFVTSTGLSGRDTAAGRFRVQSKIPMAYSSIWSLSMPYWLGIYWVGSVENGIHALPIRPNGTVMWGGLLGQRASYGCIILGNSAAQIIYNWSEIGTPVWIHY